MLENVLMQLLNYYANGFGKYLPIQSSDELMPVPILENLQKEIIKGEVNIPLQLGLVCAYLAAWFFFSKRKFETDDL